ncbi:protein kinase [Sulfurimonas aquatica]|uniref:Protein kinase n=1 Tax=Sulfurimonas aquatica TaxID=2672570 RepID=A0A975B0Y4_9BACT|nr:protein kinase [Sulfurimonas aquatica]QSZ42192.1 protein kinase [Sulfurimonas aquatica]
MNTLTMRDDLYSGIHTPCSLETNTLIDVDERDAALVTLRDGLTNSVGGLYFKTLRDCHPDTTPLIFLPSEFRTRFHNIEPLGSGSEGCLWKVEENSEFLVLKIYREAINSNTDVLDSLVSIKHDSLVPLREWGVCNNRSYEILDGVDGWTFQESIDLGYSRELSLKKILKDVSEGLSRLHSESIIHADVKPENIIYDGEKKVWRLCDYGLSAKVGIDPHLPRQGRTPFFSAPEVEAGSIVLKSDFYSLGVSILVALTSLEDLSDWKSWSGFDEAKMRWKELFVGLLEESIEKRWNEKDIQLWIDSHENKKETSTGNFKNAKQLAHKLAITWREMTSKMSQGIFEDWIRERLIELNLSDEIIKKSKSENNDIYLLKLIYVLDPNFPPQYKEYKINENNLLQIAQKVIEGDLNTKISIKEIYDNNIIGELYELTGINELNIISEKWIKQIDDYVEATVFVKSKKGEDSLFNRARDYAELYINREAKFDYELRWSKSESLCYIWVNYLVAKADKGNGYGLVASLITNHYASLLEDNLHTFTDVSEIRTQQDTGQSIILSIWRVIHNIRRFRRARRNLITPDMRVISTAVLRVSEIPVKYKLCNKELYIANRVKLSWNIKNSVMNYITEVGFVDNSGEYELTISASKVYTLYSFDARGNYQRCEVFVQAPEFTLDPTIKFNMKKDGVKNLFSLSSINDGIDMFKECDSSIGDLEPFKKSNSTIKKLDSFGNRKDTIKSLTIDSIPKADFFEMILKKLLGRKVYDMVISSNKLKNKNKKRK